MKVTRNIAMIATLATAAVLSLAPCSSLAYAETDVADAAQADACVVDVGTDDTGIAATPADGAGTEAFVGTDTVTEDTASDADASAITVGEGDTNPNAVESAEPADDTTDEEGIAIGEGTDDSDTVAPTTTEVDEADVASNSSLDTLDETDDTAIMSESVGDPIEDAALLTKLIEGVVYGSASGGTSWIGENLVFMLFGDAAKNETEKQLDEIMSKLQEIEDDIKKVDSTLTTTQLQNIFNSLKDLINDTTTSTIYKSLRDYNDLLEEELAKATTEAERQPSRGEVQLLEALRSLSGWRHTPR